MALQDILDRIEREAVEEAMRLEADAADEAGRAVAEAEERAAEIRRTLVERARAEAVVAADTLRANARLAVRDDGLRAKRGLAERALADARARLASMPDGEYVALLAARIVGVAQGGETVRAGSADAVRLRGALPEAVTAAAGRDLGLTYADEAGDFERGVVLEGDRMRVDLTLEAMVAERAEELVGEAARVLFGERGEA